MKESSNLKRSLYKFDVFIGIKKWHRNGFSIGYHICDAGTLSSVAVSSTNIRRYVDQAGDALG